LRPSRDYPRNPDGSIPIPGVGMAMADNDVNYMVLFDQLEYVRAHGRNGMAWDAQAWFGRDYDKIWFKSEGEQIKGAIDGRVEGLWSHAFAAFWDWQLGVRHDFGQSPSRQWLAFGVQGTAPYWFDVEATGYAGPGGRSAVRLKTEYTFRLSQVTFLSPELEANAYGKSDPARGIASGLSDVSLGLRLRYEIRREVAPYIGVAWTRKLGNTADLSRRAGEYVSERQVVAGVRIWF
jgi:copper resistance protein B